MEKTQCFYSHRRKRCGWLGRGGVVVRLSVPRTIFPVMRHLHVASEAECMKYSKSTMFNSYFNNKHNLRIPDVCTDKQSMWWKLYCRWSAWMCEIHSRPAVRRILSLPEALELCIYTSRQLWLNPITWCHHALLDYRHEGAIRSSEIKSDLS